MNYHANPRKPFAEVTVGSRVSVPDWRRGSVIGWTNGTVTQVQDAQGRLYEEDGASSHPTGSSIVRLDSTGQEAIYFGYSIGFEVTLGPDADTQCPNCGATGQVSAPLYELPHPRGDDPDSACKFVRIFDKRYLPEDVYEGSVDGTVTETVEDCAIEDGSATDRAVQVITDLGLTFDGGSSWAVHIDGSTIVDNYTRERSEVSAHLYGFTEDEVNQIQHRVVLRVSI